MGECIVIPYQDPNPGALGIKLTKIRKPQRDQLSRAILILLEHFNGAKSVADFVNLKAQLEELHRFTSGRIPLPFRDNPNEYASSKEIEDLEKALDEAEHAPWIVVKDPEGDNWMLCWGNDGGNDWAITTEYVRASEVKGNGPEYDARAAAQARNVAPKLLEELKDLREEVERLRREADGD